MEDFGINVFNGYGITECSPVVAVNSRSGYRAGSVGQVLPCCKVKIINKDNSGNGEICVKGDTVMMGYYNNEIATQEAFSDGWFKTGDIGYMDKDGFLYITGRKKNIIILNNGKNVYPEELEFLILKNISFVKEVLVYEDNGRIIAEAFLDDSEISNGEEQFNAHILALNRSLAPYKNIHRCIVRTEEFEKTSSKKIKRKYN